MKSAGVLLLMAAQLSAAVLATPFLFVLRALGYRFLSVNTSQIGDIIFIDLYLKEAIQEKQHHRAVFVATSRNKVANAYLFDLYSDRITYLRHPLIRLLTIPFFVNPWLTDNIYRFDVPYSHGKKAPCRGHIVHTAYAESFGRPLIAMPAADREAAEAVLTERLGSTRPFVAVHARDSGFYKDPHRTIRNANIFDYEAGLKFLIDSGYTVIRFGDPLMVDVSEMAQRLGSGFFDYAASDIKSEVMDVYILSECAFAVVCASGPNGVPPIFHKAACQINHYGVATALGYTPDSLSLCKKIRRKDDGTPIPFAEMFSPPLTNDLQHDKLAKLGYFLEDNRPEEIVAVLREFVQRTSPAPNNLQRHARTFIPDGAYNKAARGQYSTVMLKMYFPDISLGEEHGGTQDSNHTA